MLPLAPIIAGILPFLIWPLELAYPRPHLIEELAKLTVAWYINKHSHQQDNQLKLAVAAGTMFTITETILYSVNTLPLYNPEILVARFATTLPLHILTTTLLTKTYQNKTLLIPTLLISMLIHFTFNHLI